MAHLVGDPRISLRSESNPSRELDRKTHRDALCPIYQRFSARRKFDLPVTLVLLVLVILVVSVVVVGVSEILPRRRVRSVVSMPIISRSDDRSVSDYWIGYRGRNRRMRRRKR